MTVYLREEQYPEAINREWLKMFPDEEDRPARHAMTMPLRGNVFFQVEVVGVRGDGNQGKTCG